jgi:hypothetical protein
MSEPAKRFTGGCLCGALRYEAVGEPTFAGHCYCRDCQRSSGSGFIPFMGFAASAITITGEATRSTAAAANGGEAVRNHCAACGSLVYGGIYGVHAAHTIYAGTLDDPSGFEPKMAIFNSQRPAWAPIPEGITVFERMPG